MEVSIPHHVVYDTAGTTPISDVIESLLGTERLVYETASLLEDLLPGLKIESTKVRISELSQGSPLRELFLVALIAAFQQDLSKEVPPLIDEVFGTQLTGHYDSLVTVIFMIVLFYGTNFVFEQVKSAIGHSHIRAQLDGLVKEAAAKLQIEEHQLREILARKYSKNRIKVLARSAIRFFQPSKHQDNAPIMVGSRLINHDTVTELPNEASIQDYEDREPTEPLPNATIELHAQDIDRAKSGWAAVIREVTSKRLRMELYPPIKPEDLWGKSKIKGDVVVVSRRAPDGTFEPYMFHLIRVVS